MLENEPDRQNRHGLDTVDARYRRRWLDPLRPGKEGAAREIRGYYQENAEPEDDATEAGGWGAVHSRAHQAFFMAFNFSIRRRSRDVSGLMRLFPSSCCASFCVVCMSWLGFRGS